MVYTIRPHGRGFMPWVFEDGVYTVKTGEGASASAAEGLRPIKVTR
jgi:hypothetical protein